MTGDVLKELVAIRGVLTELRDLQVEAMNTARALNEENSRRAKQSMESLFSFLPKQLQGSLKERLEGSI